MENYPENTLSSIRAALAVGACMVEFDVQMDANGQLLLLHDDNFERTAGIDIDLFEQLDCARISVHEPERLGDAFNPEAVPALEQVLTELTSYPDAIAFVEIKQESLQQWGLQRVMDALLVCLQPMQHQCVLISDNLEALVYARRTSGIRIGWVIHCYDEVHRQLADEHTPDYMICNYKRIIDDLWQGRWQWMLYDITDPDLALWWADKGAALIETRDIGAMLQHPQLQRRKSQSQET
jgi:glycerophosphoryl diester phosphodiesterase